MLITCSLIIFALVVVLGFTFSKKSFYKNELNSLENYVDELEVKIISLNSKLEEITASLKAAQSKASTATTTTAKPSFKSRKKSAPKKSTK
jgi:outer membrane murein-binding lipoprotein Lpp